MNSPSRRKPKTESLSLADTKAILAAAGSTRYAARWTIALLLGLRPGEALGLTWDHVNLDTGELHVRQQLQWIAGKGLIIHPSVKTDCGYRTIKLPVFLTALLADHRSKQLHTQADDSWKGWEHNGRPVALVFTKLDGTPIPPRYDASLWSNLLTSAGLPHTRRYTARHTAATLMLDQIGDVAVVAEVLGHADPSFTYRVYVHALDEKKADLAARMESFAPYGAPYEPDLQLDQAVT